MKKRAEVKVGQWWGVIETTQRYKKVKQIFGPGVIVLFYALRLVDKVIDNKKEVMVELRVFQEDGHSFTKAVTYPSPKDIEDFKLISKDEALARLL